MSATTLSTVTVDLIGSYGNTAKNVIQAYRSGGERLVGFVEQRWERALDQSRAQLAAEVASNASAAQKVFGSYYVKGITLTADGADAVVNNVVRLAEKGVAQVAANASLFQEKTGVTALDTLAQAAVPAAVAVSTLAGKIEQKSALLANRIAGESARVAEAAPKRTAYRKARARKAA
ncbi:MAG TPA: hypothetical protein VGE70_07710 [Burkholderiaceae bacterium]